MRSPKRHLWWIAPLILFAVVGSAYAFIARQLLQTINAISVQEPTKERKTEARDIEEVFYASRDCPDDETGGESAANHWHTSVDGNKITITCHYVVYVDDEGKP